MVFGSIIRLRYVQEVVIMFLCFSNFKLTILISLLQMDNQFNSLNVKDDEEGDEETDNDDDLDIEDYMEPSMLGFISLLQNLI